MGRKRKQPASKPKPEPEPEPEPEPKPEVEEEEYEEVEEEVEEEEEENKEEESEEEEEEEEESEEEESDEEESEEEEEESEEEIDPSDKESIRKLLEPFSKDVLVGLLKEAALRTPSLAARIAASADSDPAHRKVFVHGLRWDTTTAALSAAFAPFGNIEDCRAVTDRATGHCRGYGFVLFRTRAAARRALRDPHKLIGGRTAHCQLASAGPPTGPQPEPTGRKIFVANVGPGISPERLRAFFMGFGEIEEGPLGFDRVTGKLRGFAVFTYKTEEGCQKALEEPKKVFDGCELVCQRALEGIKPKASRAPPGGVLQPNDLALSFGPGVMHGVNPVGGMVGQGLNLVGGSAGQNSGAGRVGLLNPAAGVAGLLPPAARSEPVQLPPYGVGLGGTGGSGSGISSISPGVIGSYGSPAALQGLGAYQGSQVPSSAGLRSQLGIGSLGTGMLPYLGR